MKAIVIDTNVILDLLLARSPWVASAKEILLMVAENKIQGYITASTVTDIYYVLHKHVGDRERTKRIVLDLLHVVKVLDVTGTDCVKAFELPMTDYEDALLAYYAKRHKIDCIVTRNPKHFKASPVKSLLPDAFLRAR